MSRWKAASIHLSLSLLIGLIAAAVIFGVWYPPPFSQAAGGEKLILVMLGVDLVLGPLLTLLVYKHGKRGMRFDLAVIAILQFSALVYGVSVVAGSRPVFIVGAIDRFVIVSADALDDRDLADAKQPEYRHRSWTGPYIVNALRPESSSERNDLLFSGIGGKDIENFPKYYADYTAHAVPILERAYPLSSLRKRSGAAAIIDDWLANHRQAADVAWLPLVGRGGDFTLLIDRGSGQILDVLPIEPW